ncbi:heme-dependent oxidative N-demethylase family protein [Corynebacterium neomassiliense]|uniref:heme-dependent oxidative N-demethylase family protein n=1 Tax=Corynebacterium neomassiliense TaxID=2079482 RepID=UPI00102FA763|nr:DUF3445 domain-containing protein [Corynebacterium neomassiliense]
MTVPSTTARTTTARTTAATNRADGVYRQPLPATPQEADRSLAEFPFPFPHETYRYSANVEPAEKLRRSAAGQWGETVIDIDRHYAAELREKDRILTVDPSRYVALPHMLPAEWDALLAVLNELAVVYPGSFTLTRTSTAKDGEDRKDSAGAGDSYHWSNRLSDPPVEQDFTVGDSSTLPCAPLEFAGRQVQEDIALLAERDGMLWGDSMVVTFAADWSPAFDAGMSFPEIHGPVPRVHEQGIVDRAQKFIMGLRPGQRFRRTNWTLTIDGRLDTGTESYPEWGPDRMSVVNGPLREVGDRVFLRVEVQHLIRLQWSGAVMFLIRTYLQPLSTLVRVPEWATRVRDVLAELPEDMAEYKGVHRTRWPAVEWLETVGGVDPATRPEVGN